MRLLYGMFFCRRLLVCTLEDGSSGEMLDIKKVFYFWFGRSLQPPQYCIALGDVKGKSLAGWPSGKAYASYASVRPWVRIPHRSVFFRHIFFRNTKTIKFCHACVYTL